MSSPSSRTRPRSAGSSPTSARNRVDLPAPDGPRIPTTSPRVTSKLTPRMIFASPRTTSRSSAESAMVDMLLGDGDRALHLGRGHVRGLELDRRLVGLDPPLAARELHPAPELEGLLVEIE